MSIGSSSNNQGPPDKRESTCDCVRVGPISPNSALPTNAILVANNQPYHFSNTASAGDYWPGMAVCVSGARYADNNNGDIACGQVSGNQTASYEYNDAGDMYYLDDAILTNIRGIDAGDSGSPNGNGGDFLGITSAATYAYGMGGVYIPIGTVISKSTHFDTMGVTLAY